MPAVRVIDRANVGGGEEARESEVETEHAKQEERD